MLLILRTFSFDRVASFALSRDASLVCCPPTIEVLITESANEDIDLRALESLLMLIFGGVEVVLLLLLTDSKLLERFTGDIAVRSFTDDLEIDATPPTEPNPGSDERDLSSSDDPAAFEITTFCFRIEPELSLGSVSVSSISCFFGAGEKLSQVASFADFLL